MNFCVSLVSECEGWRWGWGLILFLYFFRRSDTGTIFFLNHTRGVDVFQLFLVCFCLIEEKGLATGHSLFQEIL